jgi:hypothetical protein
MVESQKIKYKNQFIQFILEVAVLECSFLYHSQGILEVNFTIIVLKIAWKSMIRQYHEIA